MDLAPGRKIPFRARVGTGDVQLITRLQLFDFCLGSYYRHWTKQIARIQTVLSHDE